ncbi:phosphatidate phosphatase LPIN2-like isoform X2 [Patiria miniata]|uniref:phosphatidate phosphatase n=1 Tax=Patiria miniata TaxID=46514 RepID=A0A913ZJI0_PATMI|nr:phosphatidate phosphatase LPIN2-like isoform X2 [Patiria miniata]
MNYVGRFLSSVKTFYSEINPATLTGAIDVIVAQQDDGSLLCSPFHVRFGKMGVLRSREKVVYIEINGEQVDLHMKLGENGEAFFLEEATDEDKVPAHLCSSPLLSTINLMEDGMKKLHAEANQVRSESESSKESDTSLGRDTSSAETLEKKERNAERVLEALKEPESGNTIVDIRDLTKDEPVAITVETEIGRGKNKKQLQFKGAIKSSDFDIENGSEDESQKSNVASAISSTAKETLVRIENETKSNRRGRMTKKRKHRSSGTKPTRTEKPPSDGFPEKSSISRRLMNLSESSTSSSQHSDTDEEIFEMEDVSEEEGPSGRAFKPLKKAQSEVWGDVHQEMLKVQIPQHPLSDGDITPAILSPVSTRPPSPKSDTELEMARVDRKRSKSTGHIRSSSSTDKIEWNWGELPGSLRNLKGNEDKSEKEEGTVAEGESTDLESQQKTDDKKSVWSKFNVFRNIQHSQGVEQGMYLQDLASEEIDPEVYALYFPERAERSNRIDELRDEDKSSDLGSSLPQSPNTVEEVSGGVAYQDDSSESSMELQMSLCGGLKEEDDSVPHDVFMKHLVTYDEFCKSPGLLSNPNLVVRLDAKYYNWQAAGPVIISYLAFRRPLPEPVVTTLMKDQVPKGKRSLTSWLWGPAKPPTTPTKKGSESNGEASGEVAQDREESRHRDDTVYWSDETESSEKAAEPDHQTISGSPSNIYKKSIRLSSDQLAKLNLKPGPNVIKYSVTTRYQGTTSCESTIYLWKHDSKIIISDIDGTITRSDVFGQILPVLGKDWTHGGVAQLFSQIQKNGYVVLYLSSRAIGQARHTKGFLKSVCQDKFALPDGPLLLNPSSLIRAFHREVIIKKPEEFKIRCLKDIQSLFPSSMNSTPCNPFYAGFGNRINDTWAYRAVGIPVSRIFTINSQGKVTHDHTYTFQSSYPKMQALVEHVFPSLHRQQTMAFVSPHDYSSFTFWREPIHSLPDDDELVKSLTAKDKK